MSSTVLGLRVAGTIFGLMCLAQLARFAVKVDILIGGHRLPLWPSLFAFVVLAGLSIWMWRLSAQNNN
jgi:hypothetical protein